MDRLKLWMTTVASWFCITYICNSSFGVHYCTPKLFGLQCAIDPTALSYSSTQELARTIFPLIISIIHCLTSVSRLNMLWYYRSSESERGNPSIGSSALEPAAAGHFSITHSIRAVSLPLPLPAVLVVYAEFLVFSSIEILGGSTSSGEGLFLVLLSWTLEGGPRRPRRHRVDGSSRDYVSEEKFFFQMMKWESSSVGDIC